MWDLVYVGSEWSLSTCLSQRNLYYEKRALTETQGVGVGSWYCRLISMTLDTSLRPVSPSSIKVGSHYPYVLGLLLSNHHFLVPLGPPGGQGLFCCVLYPSLSAPRKNTGQNSSVNLDE